MFVFEDSVNESTTNGVFGSHIWCCRCQGSVRSPRKPKFNKLAVLGEVSWLYLLALVGYVLGR